MHVVVAEAAAAHLAVLHSFTPIGPLSLSLSAFYEGHQMPRRFPVSLSPPLSLALSLSLSL